MALQLGLVGYPIQHSLSPWIHHQFMKQEGIDGTYHLFETTEDQLENTFEQIRDRGVDGFNITVPYKQKIMKFLDELDEDAQRIGAVNTVVHQNGKWKGYNTDGQGYVHSVKRSYPNLFKEETKVLVLGAGGAARGIYRALVQESFEKVDVANRTTEKAKELLDVKKDHIQTDILTYQAAEQQLNAYDFIVQTTSVGMKPNTNDQVISLDHVKPGAVVSDIVYQPLMTELLLEAKARGANIHQGHAMLLYQAQLAFKIWTGKDVDAEKILEQLEMKLRRSE
ncbi:shikimate dehydrogenase [Aquibacillus koreensis]|uniref:Shikimate dehydrogenase (NADP(+)) n=1 Tax=Aquibacillus koreensis TaxID=279446 RepID=A0A9X4AGW5_9BACI|nr:shikimate dehydrogenase [Aquibacillus koreensis]MCT2537633.1 shikimate dehydrogenase [Aquibacillus koreensis]MDC3419079.1 shikimate dehydrogenase [Aquibacillus koreensis]